MENWVDTVVLKWKSEGVKINNGASEELIKSAERKLDFIFPDDFKLLYTKMNGFKDLDWQEHMFHFLPLEMIVSETLELKDTEFIGVCDFLLASHYIGFKKSKPGIYKIYPSIDYEDNNSIAQTFQEVINLINTNSTDIY